MHQPRYRRRLILGAGLGGRVDGADTRRVIGRNTRAAASVLRSGGVVIGRRSSLRQQIRLISPRGFCSNQAEMKTAAAAARKLRIDVDATPC